MGSDSDESGEIEPRKERARPHRRPPEDKHVRLEREKQALLSSLAGCDFTTTRTRVAAVLNMYPDSRNSDVSLALKFWETFQPDIYNPGGIRPRDLFRLERFHLIVRARAKIQNEYGLYQADEQVRRHRKQREEDIQEAVIQDTAPRRTVHVFADETGKTQKYVLVAAVWLLSGLAVFKLDDAIRKWKVRSNWGDREIHFSKFGRQDAEALRTLLDVVNDNREFLSFKVIAFEKARTGRSIEEVVRKLHEHMLVRGAIHEVENGRIDLPREVEMTVDEEQSLDPFTLAEMKQTVGASLQQLLGDALMIQDIRSVSSRHSPMIQLADLVAGAVNRRLNHMGDRGAKDDIADMVIERLALDLGEGDVPGLDATALFMV